MKNSVDRIVDSEDTIGQENNMSDKLFDTLDHTKEKNPEQKEFYIDDDSTLIIRSCDDTGQAWCRLEDIRVKKIKINDLHKVRYGNCIGDIYFIKRMAARIQDKLFYNGAKIYREKEDADGSAHYNYDTLSTRITEIHPIFVINDKKYLWYQGILTEIYTEDFETYPEVMSKIVEIDGIIIDGEVAKRFIALDDVMQIIQSVKK